MPYTIKTLEAINFLTLDYKTLMHIKTKVDEDILTSKGIRLARLRVIAQKIDDILWIPPTEVLE